MHRGPLSRVAQALGINSVPIVGVFLGNWSSSTTLVVYWSETLLAVAFTAGRILVHRKLTRKKGHYRDQWEHSARRRTRHTLPRRPFKTFLSGFLLGSLSLTVGLGLFLALLLATVLRGTIDRAAIGNGVLWMAVAQAAAFGWDMFGIREWPFARVRDAANDVMGRVVLIHLGMLVGMFVLAWIGRPPAFFGAFVLMKLAADVVGLLTGRGSEPVPPGQPPAWAARMIARIDRTGDFERNWRRQLARERTRVEEEEQVYESAASTGPDSG
jgi:hypothetical protein